MVFTYPKIYLTSGRLQKILHVGLPSPDDRVSILKAITKRRPVLGPDVDYVELATDKVFIGYPWSSLVEGGEGSYLPKW